MKTNKSVIQTAIIGITILEGIALTQGINGFLLTAAIATIAGLAGWTMPQLKLK